MSRKCGFVLHSLDTDSPDNRPVVNSCDLHYPPCKLSHTKIPLKSHIINEWLLLRGYTSLGDVPELELGQWIYPALDYSTPGSKSNFSAIPIEGWITRWYYPTRSPGTSRPLVYESVRVPETEIYSPNDVKALMISSCPRPAAHKSIMLRSVYYLLQKNLFDIAGYEHMRPRTYYYDMGNNVQI